MLDTLFSNLNSLFSIMLYKYKYGINDFTFNCNSSKDLANKKSLIYLLFLLIAVVLGSFLIFHFLKLSKCPLLILLKDFKKSKNHCSLVCLSVTALANKFIIYLIIKLACSFNCSSIVT